MSESPLMLSVSGVRGIVGQTLTPAAAARFAAAFGGWVREAEGNTHAPHVVVGRDSRRSGEMLEMAAVSGLLAVGCRVTRLGVATTPGTAIMTDALHADAGLVITASHNPGQWNGLKPLRRGSAPPKHEAEQIIERFRNEQTPYVDVAALHTSEHRNDTDRIHTERILQCVDVEAIKQAGLTVAVNSIHGAGGRETLALLQGLGIGVNNYYHFYAEPTGDFPHAPEPTADNLAAFCEEVKPYKPDVVFVQDPDADRLAIIDENAQYIGEEYTLALCAMHMLQKGQTAVANLSTSRMIDDVAEQAGATVVRTPVGEANVAAAMREHDAAIGGEGNGGVILPRVSLVRDSLVGIALILEMLAKRKQRLSEVVQQLPAYAIVKEKAAADDRLTRALGETLREQYADQTIDQQDGVRIDWPDSWVHVRPSNTEPIVRLVAEARDGQRASSLLAEVKQTLGIDGDSGHSG